MNFVAGAAKSAVTGAVTGAIKTAVLGTDEVSNIVDVLQQAKQLIGKAKDKVSEVAVKGVSSHLQNSLGLPSL